MYQCPNCGSGLKYDIEQGELVCNHCQSMFSPYEVDRETDGYEDEFFEATHFVCPQCGGEILSTDNAAAGFCSYCGASTILTSRISKELKPSKIIPFKVSKDQCHVIFKNRMRKAIFAPKAFKDVNNIQGFRGIYMPYWLYRTKQNNNVKIKGEKKYRQGNYMCTDHFDINAYIQAEYNGFYYDASSAFYDNISEPLAPFDFSDSMEFVPSFYSGFYADIPDVPREVYEDSAIEESLKASYDKLSSNVELRGLNVAPELNNNDIVFERQLETQCDMAQGVMLPVWFMSYRAGNRVAYATVNGQTGKIITDVPVDKKKYILGSCILALPIFLLLNFLFTFIPSTTLTITSMLAAISSAVLANEMSSIYKKENNIDDRGLLWIRSNKIKSGIFGRRFVAGSGKTGDQIANIMITVIVAAVMCFIALPILSTIPKGKAILSLICMASSVGCMVDSKSKFKGLNVRGKHIYFVPVISAIMATLILFANPVSDIYYYAGSIIQIVAVIIVFMAIIGNYNILCMRYLPQFDKKGGDDNA